MKPLGARFSPAPCGESGVVVVGPHADDQHEHIDAHAQRTARQRVLGLDLHPAVDRRAGLRDTPAQKMDVVFLLRLAVHLLIAGAEHADVHVEIEDIGFGEEPLHLHSLLHARDAAHFRTVLLAHLLVARTHAVQKRDALGTRSVGPGHAAFVEHALDVHRRENVVVDAVAVLLLDRGVEEREARRHHHRIARQHPSVGEQHAARRESLGLGGGQHLDAALVDPPAQLGQHLLRGRERREQHVPPPELAAQFGLLLDDRGLDALLRQTQGRLHACDAAAYDYYLLLHYSLMS